jgi:polyhydroxybutyrate depolymerase
VATGDLAASIVFGGLTRPVVVHVPSGYTDRTPVALVLNLHGSGSTAAAQEAFSGMDSTSNTDGFIVAYPEGGISSGSGYDWNVPGEPLFGGGAAPANAPNDVAFLAHVVQRLEAGLCIDPSRVFSTGFSGGARMTSQLGCDLPGTIAAIAPVSGLRLPSPCTGTRAVPVISFHGTADPIDPYDGNGQAY